MTDDSANKKPKHKAEPKPDRDNQLLFGKAVLLIGNDTAVLQNLVEQLAKKGADITLLCWQMPLQAADEMKAHVQSLGRQLILIERVENQRFSVEQLIHSVTTRWGPFDVFIDMSVKVGSKTAVPNNAKDKGEQKETRPEWLPPKWQLTRTILEEMAHN